MEAAARQSTAATAVAVDGAGRPGSPWDVDSSGDGGAYVEYFLEQARSEGGSRGGGAPRVSTWDSKGRFKLVYRTADSHVEFFKSRLRLIEGILLLLLYVPETKVKRNKSYSYLYLD